MNGIIILDGPDACGKSTLQKYLTDNYGATGMHLTYPAPLGMNMFEYQSRELKYAISLAEDKLVVVDRHWISEMIYAKVFRGGSPWPLMGRLMHRMWMRYSAVTVLCVPHTLELALERHETEKDPSHPYPAEKYQELCAEYLTFVMKTSYSPYFMYYTIEQHGKYMDYFCRRLIGQILNLQMTQIAMDYSDPNLGGHRSTAKALLVGEKLNPKKFHHDFTIKYPFYEYANSSLYLIEQLEQVGISEDMLMWTNADKPHYIKPLYEDGLKVITLGGEAGTVVSNLGVPHETICHPAYATRFGIKDYHNILLEAVWK